MSKICGCKKQFIHDILEDLIVNVHIRIDGYIGPTKLRKLAVDNTLAIADILESDCVCEKKDDGNGPKDFMVIHVDEGLPDEHTEVVCMKCKHQATVQLEEKQSQSPCEHELTVRDLPDANDIKNYFFRFYCCYKCGLVTCKNPNQ